MGADVISVPLPILASVLCAVIAPLMLRLDLGRATAARLFAAVFACFALQSLLVGLRFGYGQDQFITFQRVLPLTTGPLLYLGFLSLAVPEKTLFKRIVIHLGGAILLAVGLSLFANIYRDFDFIIGASYLLYAVLLIRLARLGPDNLIHARLDIARSATRWMVGAAALLLILLSLDTAIAVNFAIARGNQAPALVTLGSVMLIVMLLVILTNLPTRLALQRGSQSVTNATGDADAIALENDARQMLLRSEIFLDPDLTVQRIARRLSVPERALSNAINQTQGTNVSQYVNGFRLTHAAALLRETDDAVSKVMLQSGFLTRSNFYREFQRVFGQSPASYRKGK